MSSFEPDKTYAVFSSPANKKLIGKLLDAGSKIIFLPEVRTTEVLGTETDRLLGNLSGFDWIVFSTLYAVEYFLQALERLEIDFFELDSLRICACGETIADRLRYAQVHSDVISNLAHPASAYSALNDYEPRTSELNFLVPAGKGETPEISRLLEETGSRIAAPALYQIEIGEPSTLTKIKALLAGGAIDEIIFCSPLEAADFSILFSTVDFSELLSETVVTATDPATGQALREFGVSRIGIKGNV